MSRPRKLDALSPAERARRYRIRCKGVTEISTVTETVTKTPAVTETQILTADFGHFETACVVYCEWFPWVKDCTLDRLQKSPFNVVNSQPGTFRPLFSVVAA